MTMKREILFGLGLFALALAGCVTSQAMQDRVRKRASFDLDCPEAELKIVEFESPKNTGPSSSSSGSWGASGCGKHAAYVQVASTGTIVMNNAGEKPVRSEPAEAGDK
jgi:hypothetical protein